MDRRSRKGDLQELIQHLSQTMDCQAILITRGTNGSFFYRQNEGFTVCPAFAINIVDRVGAGDAVLSIASLLAAHNVPSDVISFIGNVMGAEAVSIIGNKRAVDKSQLMNSISSFLQE